MTLAVKVENTLHRMAAEREAMTAVTVQWSPIKKRPISQQDETHKTAQNEANEQSESGKKRIQTQIDEIVHQIIVTANLFHHFLKMIYFHLN